MPDVDPFPRARARTILLVTVITAFTTPFMISAVVVALPVIEREYGMSAMELGWISSAYLLASAMFLLPFGSLADMVGRRRVFLAGALVHVVASLLTIVAPSGSVLIAFRAFQGLASALIYSTMMAMLVSAYPPTERGRVLGISVSFTYLGLSLGPFAGGFLTQQLGWRSIFVIAVVLGVAMAGLMLLRVPAEPRPASRVRYDYAGAALSALSLAALMYGMSVLPGAAGIVLLTAGVAGLSAFILWETRRTDPMLDVGLFRGNSVFMFSNVAALINYSATFAVTFLLSLYLQYIQGFSTQIAGVVLVVQPAIMTGVSLVAGRLSDRIEPRILATTGMSVIVAGLVMCAFVTAATPLSWIIAILALLGAGFGLFSSPNTNAVMSSIERRHFSIGSAVLGTMRLCGQVMSMGIVILIFSNNVGRTHITPEMYPSFLEGMRVSFVVFAALSVLGVASSMARGKIREH